MTGQQREVETEDGEVIEKKAGDRQGRGCETRAGNSKNGQFP